MCMYIHILYTYTHPGNRMAWNGVQEEPPLQRGSGTGLTAQQYKMQVIANNLANVNTTGFKRDRANFESLFYQIVKNAGSQTADNTALTSPLAVGTGVKVVSTQKLFTQGGLVSTDNSLDLAIDGSGFFQALLPDGRVGYTRAGVLSRNAEGLLTTSSGYVVQPQITIPNDATGINYSTVTNLQ